MLLLSMVYFMAILIQYVITIWLYQLVILRKLNNLIHLNSCFFSMIYVNTFYDFNLIVLACYIT